MNLSGDEQILDLSDANIVLLFEITKLYWKFFDERILPNNRALKKNNPPKCSTNVQTWVGCHKVLLYLYYPQLVNRGEE